MSTENFDDKPDFEIIDNDESQQEPQANAEIAKLEADLQKAKSDYLYLRADFDNYRKRMIEERSQYIRYAGENVFRDILGVLDNFDLALQTKLTNENLESFEQGIQMIRKEISNSLERHGVSEIEVHGTDFDPSKHEALSAEETEEMEEGKVYRVFKKAYKLHDRVLRPAQVVVSKTKKSEAN